MNPRQTDSTGFLFNVHLLPPSRTDLSIPLWACSIQVASVLTVASGPPTGWAIRILADYR